LPLADSRRNVAVEPCRDAYKAGHRLDCVNHRSSLAHGAALVQPHCAG
jgi:hypothetical protein